MSFILGLKLTLVIIFLVIFLRRPTWPWGIGLLTVTSAVLFDTLLGTFNAESLRADLGFFYFVLVGFLLGGGAFWVLGLLWPHLPLPAQAPSTAVTPGNQAEPAPAFAPFTSETGTVYDVQQIYTDLHTKLDDEALRDLCFDLEYPPTLLLGLPQDQPAAAEAIIIHAQKENDIPTLGLGVDRLLSPPAPESLPRLEKITANSPRPILRCYVLAHFDLPSLEKTAETLQIDWQQLPGTTLQGKTRELLAVLYQQQRLTDLITHLQATDSEAITVSKSMS